MVPVGIAEHRAVGDDQRVGAEPGGTLDGVEPRLRILGRGEGVQRHQHLGVARVGVAHAFAQLRVVEVQAGECPCVGLVAQAQIDGVGAGVDGQLQRAQRARRADQLGLAAPAWLLHGM
ncbi:hypothetical protein GALL_393340 [mine drainage metagenome]|uniref:Uncharacterized protein n=1 Tax=mine drainage metagenome TaxID=410659 RepID=A0A1J5Q5L2_9ZZZZ